jgi:outer membrane protein OmpA-like peptidoglycan-associated protein
MIFSKSTPRLLKPLLVLLIGFGLLLAGNGVGAADAPDSQDHPLIDRFPDTDIYQYLMLDYDEIDLITSPYDPRKKAFETRAIEGKITRIHYTGKKQHSMLQIFRNYEKAFNKLAVKTVFACSSRKKNCGGNASTFFGTALYNEMQKSGFNLRSGTYEGADFRFLFGTFPHNGTTAHAMLYVGKIAKGHAPEILLTIVEPESLNTNQVGINLDALKNGIAAQGKVVLAGLYFDLGKSRLKSESDKSLKVIADFLTINTGQHFFVTGHTDNSGDYEHNLSLSLDRANAVIEALAGRYKVARERLKAVGVGPVSPAGSNANETGQAANRRVELVLMGGIIP